MARPSKVRKRPSEKAVRDTASAATGNNTTTAAVAHEAAAAATLDDGPATPHKATKDNNNHKGYISSSKAQITAIDDDDDDDDMKKKPRGDSISISISARELNAMATRQLLASLGSTVPVTTRVRVSLSSQSTRGGDKATAKPSIGFQKISPSAWWSLLAGATVLSALLIALLPGMATEGGSALA